MSFSYKTLESEEARTAFRAAYRSTLLQSALSLTHSQQEAEQLTAQVFKRMEQRYQSTSLPSAIDLMLLSQVNLIYAQGTYKRTESEPAQKVPESQPSTTTPQPSTPTPQPLTPAAPMPASQAASDTPSRSAERLKRGSSIKIKMTARETHPVRPMQPMRPAQPEPSTQLTQAVQPSQQPLPSQYAYPSQSASPVQPTYAAQPMPPAYPAAYPMAQPVPTGMQGYRYAPPSYVAPPVMPIQYGIQPVVMDTMPMVMMPCCPAQSIAFPQQRQQPAQPAAEPAEAPSKAPAKKQKKSRKESYDPTVTELWTPDDASEETETAAIVRTPAPQQSSAAEPAPGAYVPSDADFDEETSKRSIPLTIFNTFLFIGLIGSIIFLLMQLNVLPRLI